VGPVLESKTGWGNTVQKYKVCVADDCLEETTLLCEGLRMYHYEALPAASGREALRICNEDAIDLILLDIGLPDIDGREVCRRLKANWRTADIPVIFITARGESQDVIEGYDIGAVDYVVKPYNLPMVLVTVERALQTRQPGPDMLGDYASFGDNAYTDTLTGLRNQRYFIERLQEEIDKAHRYDYPVSCLVLDVHETRAVDAELGMASLDDLLVEIAMAMRNTSRNYDILARLEGAFFGALLPHAPLESAVQYANKIQHEIVSTTFSDPVFPTLAKLSFGLVTCRNGSAKCGADRILGEAMRNLFHASTRSKERLVARDLAE
jgi:two-component system, cell cycle response regulator